MEQIPQLQTMTEYPYSPQRPARKITGKVIFYVAFGLAWIAFFVFNLFITSLTRDWFWECLTFVVSIGGAILTTIYTRQLRARQAQTMSGKASSPTTSQRGISILALLYGALALIALFVFTVLMYHGNQLGKDLLTSFFAGSGVTWGFELANRESRDPVAPGPFRNRQGNYD